MPEFDNIKVKDQLGRPEDINIEVKRFTDEVVVESNTLHISTHTIGASFILGSSTNGILGTNQLGEQDSMVWGSVDYGEWGSAIWGERSRILTTVAVVNPNKVFREHFTTTYFEDTDVTTADWADTAETLVFTNGEIAQSKTIAYNNGTVTKATLSATASAGDTADLSLQLTADGGSNWENATIGTEHTFTNTGTDLRFKLTASGSVTASFISVSYQ